MLIRFDYTVNTRALSTLATTRFRGENDKNLHVSTPSQMLLISRQKDFGNFLSVCMYVNYCTSFNRGWCPSTCHWKERLHAWRSLRHSALTGTIPLLSHYKYCREGLFLYEVFETAILARSFWTMRILCLMLCLVVGVSVVARKADKKNHKDAWKVGNIKVIINTLCTAVLGSCSVSCWCTSPLFKSGLLLWAMVKFILLISICVSAS